MQVHTSEIKEWAADLDDFQYSLFITPEWIESLQKPGRKPVYIDFKLQQETVAKIAGLAFDSGKTYQHKLYFHAGPALRLNSDRVVVEQCLDALVHHARKNNFSRVSMLSYDYPYLIPVKKHFKFNERVEYKINLEIEAQQVQMNFSNEILRNYRKAVKNNCLCVEDNRVSVIELLIPLLSETQKIRKSKGYEDYNPFYIPLFEKETLAKLIHSRAIRIFTVTRDTEMLAITMVMVRDHKAYALFAGVSGQGYSFGVPSFMNYSIVNLLKKEGYRYLNFGGIPLEKSASGLVGFKKSLGAFPVKSSYGSTNFLLFPYSLINPLMSMARTFPENRFVKIIQRNL